MSNNAFSRPTGNRFALGKGIDLRHTPDQLSPDSYAALQNVRNFNDLSFSTRPGITQLFAGNTIPITDIKAYSTLGTDNNPRFLARNQNNTLILDTGTVITTLVGLAGPGVSMNSFRPNQSPQAWMYVAGYGDYKKISAPTAVGSSTVTVAKVGIAEPQVAVDFQQTTPTFFNNATGAAVNWTAGGTAGATSNVDILGGTGNSIGGAGGPDTTNWAVIADPIIGSRYSIGVNSNFFLPNNIVTIGGAANLYLVDAVFQPINQTTISSIRYDSGTSGACSIILPFDYSSFLLRGSVIVLDNGTNKEAVFVLSCQTSNGQGTCQIRASTVNTYAAGNNVFGELIIVVYPIGTAPAPPSGTITLPSVSSSITAGTGTLTQTYTGNNFGKFGPNDYVHFSFQSGNLTTVTNISIQFDTSNGLFTDSFFTYSISSTALLNVLADNLTEINFPISALINNSANLGEFANTVAIRISVSTGAATMTFAIQALWVGGGNGADVGYLNTGASNLLPGYNYVVVPRASASGAIGNPSPAARYSAFPHRQQILVKTSAMSFSYDTQIDTLDIYRYGGSVTSYQYVGSTTTGTDFTDSFTDAFVSAGPPLQTDNFEPWPSLAKTFTQTATLTIVGTWLTLTLVPPSPNNIASWLPGTLITVTGFGTFTLRSRPTHSGNTYTFEFLQIVGTFSGTGTIVVQEAVVANNPLPFVSGPDTNGFFFAVGDSLRPGVIYYSKANNPDSAPQVNTAELSPPSEPLVGMEIINGVVYVCSTRRWWAGYPNTFATAAPFFTFVEQAIGPVMVSHFAKVSNGTTLFYFDRNGISRSDGGAAAKSITNLRLLPLFPQDGVLGKPAVVGNITFGAPDYTKPAQFRLGIAGRYLYADYVDTNFGPHTLVYDIDQDSWVSNDVYGNLSGFAGGVLVHYGPLLQTGPLAGGGGTTTPYTSMNLLGGSDGNVYVENSLTNDSGIPITCVVQTSEWDGGDQRTKFLFGDVYLDSIPQSGISVAIEQFGLDTISPVTTSAASSRTFSTISLGGEVLQKFLGLRIFWTDDFTKILAPTTIFLWQPSVIPQPEQTLDRMTDFYDFGQAMYVRGFTLTADTGNLGKNLTITPDVGSTLTIGIQHNGQQEITYTFLSPFVAHEIKLAPDKIVPWRFWNLKWIMDPWPEQTAGPSPWFNFGAVGAKYIRGITVPMETGANPVTLNAISSDTGISTPLGPFLTTALEKTEVSFAVTTPLIGHEFQFIPSAIARVWWDELKVRFEPWPELIPEATPWMTVGPGAQYITGLTIPLDTNGGTVNLKFLSSDGNTSVTISGVSTTSGQKTMVPLAFQPPIVAHELQIIPSGPARIWWPEVSWHATPYAEIVAEDTPILLTNSADNSYVQGLKLTADSGGIAVGFNVLGDGGVTVATISPVIWSGKQTIPIVFSVPFLAHNWQLVPTGNIRIFTAESKWVYEPTPEKVSQWGPTQWTSHGQTGYIFLYRLEASYSSTQTVSLSATSFDGTSPSPIILPATGGVPKRFMFAFTPNKGKLFQYSASSSAPFQLFLNDWTLWLGVWGTRTLVQINNLGEAFGDKAKI